MEVRLPTAAVQCNQVLFNTDARYCKMLCNDNAHKPPTWNLLWLWVTWTKVS